MRHIYESNEHNYTLTISSTMKPKKLIYGYELTKKEKKDFDYMEDIDREAFFRYCRRIYALDDFMRLDDTTELSEKGFWHGYSPDSFFSGTLVHSVNEDEVIVGFYLS